MSQTPHNQKMTTLARKIKDFAIKHTKEQCPFCIKAMQKIGDGTWYCNCGLSVRKQYFYRRPLKDYDSIPNTKSNDTTGGGMAGRKAWKALKDN